MKQFEIYLVKLNPTLGSEISKTRPAIIISPDEMNDSLETVIISPLTSTIKNWPSRIPLKFNKKEGEVALDQIRTVDKIRLKKKLGKASPNTSKQILERLREIFS